MFSYSSSREGLYGPDLLIGENGVLGDTSLDCVYAEHPGTVVSSSREGGTYFSNNITRLQVPQRLDELVHGPIEIAFCI